MNIEITEENAGKTVKEILNGYLHLSSNLITKLKKDEQGILLNGRHVTVRAVVTTGDLLSLATEKETVNPFLLPFDMPLSVLYEDDAVIAVNKPPYMPTHPSHGHLTDTLANGVCAYMTKRGLPFVFRAVNRLDRNTSGVVLIAKSTDAAYRFSSLVANGGMEKTYLALVSGFLDDKGQIEGYIRRTEGSVITRELLPLPAEGASYSLTQYETQKKGIGASLLRLHPQTGRTHQLRVHLSSVGHPIVGDELYGGEEEARHMLHAVRLSFIHPYTHQACAIHAPIPNDFICAASKKGITLYE